PWHCLEPGPEHGLRIPGGKVVDPVKESGETLIVHPAAGIVAVRQGGDAPRRCQYPDRWARRNRAQAVDHAVLILRKESFERVSDPKSPGDFGHEAGRPVWHPGAHVDRVRADWDVVEED